MNYSVWIEYGQKVCKCCQEKNAKLCELSSLEHKLSELEPHKTMMSGEFAGMHIDIDIDHEMYTLLYENVTNRIQKIREELGFLQEGGK